MNTLTRKKPTLNVLGAKAAQTHGDTQLKCLAPHVSRINPGPHNLYILKKEIDNE